MTFRYSILVFLCLFLVEFVEIIRSHTEWIVSVMILRHNMRRNLSSVQSWSVLLRWLLTADIKFFFAGLACLVFPSLRNLFVLVCGEESLNGVAFVFAAFEVIVRAMHCASAMVWWLLFVRILLVSCFGIAWSRETNIVIRLVLVVRSH